MRDGYQTHVVMPTRPTTRLILRHPQVALAVLQVFFDPKTTTADQGQGLQPHLRRRVGDVILELRLVCQRTPNHQPNRRTRLAVPHRPHLQRRELEHQGRTMRTESSSPISSWCSWPVPPTSTSRWRSTSA